MLKSLVRSVFEKFGYVVLDTRKDQANGRFLPGHLKALFERLRINCVIDVGANRGNYAAALRAFGYDGRIVSIEPLPDVFAELEKRAAADPNWIAVNVALGCRDEVRQLNIFRSRDLSSFLPPSDHMNGAVPISEVEQVVSVTVKTLDSVMPEFVAGMDDARVFLKIDTQGYDLEVVRGAANSIPRIFALQSELSVVPLYHGMPDYLEALGYYKGLGFTPTGFFAVVGHLTTHRVLEFDVVFIRDQSS